MRKLLFFSIVMSSLLNAKAQVETHKLESVPMQKPSLEREAEVLFAPTNEASGLSNYYYSNKPVRKDGDVTYRPFGEVHNAWFSANDRTNSLSRWSFAYLFPDSLANTYSYYENGDSIRKHSTMWASTGFVFDPYSKGFDNFFQYGLFEDREGTYYGYRLDTLKMSANYSLPNGYDPSSPDSLHIYIAYFGPYPPVEDSGADRGDFWTLRYSSASLEANALSPKYIYPPAIPHKGVGPVMQSANKRMIGYELTERDSALPGPGYVTRRGISVPIPGGYEVPAGYCLGVVVQYIPGFKYNHVDTNTTTTNYSLANDSIIRVCDTLNFGRGILVYKGEDSTFNVGDILVFENDTLTFGDDTTFYEGIDTLYMENVGIIFGKDITFQTGDVLMIENDTVVFENDTLLYKFDTIPLSSVILYHYRNDTLTAGTLITVYDTTYFHHDTLYILTWNTDLPTPPGPFRREDRRMNAFALIAWDFTGEDGKILDDADFLWDNRGFNSFLMETQGIRYKNPQTANDSGFVNRSSYATGWYLKTAFWMSLSVDDDFTVNVSNHEQNLISQIYPNPATTRLTVDLNEADKANVTIYNILGQAVIEETLHGISNSISIAELSSGLYFVKVTQNGRSHTVKISKE